MNLKKDKPVLINKSRIIQVETCTVCANRCSGCTRGIHLRDSLNFHTLEYIEQALKSLSETKYIVGCFGGEPTLHPEFEKICHLYQKYYTKSQCGLWTSGGNKFKEHRKLIDQTFGIINYNNHSGAVFHQPPFISVKEIISDDIERSQLITMCWVHHLWSAIITPNGAYFCEVASTLDHFLKKNLGVPFDKNWLKDQRLNKQYELCQECGMCLKTLSVPDSHHQEIISQNFQKLIPEKHNTRLQICRDIQDLKEIGNMVQWKYASSKQGSWFKAPILFRMGYCINYLRYITRRLFKQ